MRHSREASSLTSGTKGSWTMRKGGLSTVIPAIGSVVALVAIAAAYAAYTSPKFEVTQTGTTTTMKVSVDPDDDPTAMMQITVPSGTRVTANQAPGTVLGRARAVVKALDFGGADLALDGHVRVATPGEVSAAVEERCMGGTTLTATWILDLSGAAGGQLAVPVFFVAWQAPPGNIYVCFAPPDVPAGTPGRAPFGAKLVSLEATFTNVFSPSACTWRGAFWPFTPLVGEINWSGPVGFHASSPSPAMVVRLTARRAGAGANLVGRVTEAGTGRSDATVTIFGGSVPGKLKWLGRPSVAVDGAFFRASAATPCFTAHSKEVRKR